MPDRLVTAATIYLIKVYYWLFQSLYRSRSLRVSRSSSLDFRQPTSPASPSALSPWKPSPTGSDGCLRRRPVLHSAHLTPRKRAGAVMLSLLAPVLKNLQTPLLQHLPGPSSPFRTVAPLLLRLVPPPQRCKIHFPVLDRAPIPREALVSGMTVAVVGLVCSGQLS